ncbi:hypothetical protein [Peribacillus asahii]|uniref:Uncharacterized protein n=1 Tax=Peribacillus asahii TaxID=228899 RepID=A0A3Q9RNB3_9BACI|nr:hypothetical protein [Peribacillus asahii]AZV43156.1 hypothetical protein BAOM_2547 [Peribacillus asahii]USK83254.1 hypothetical protein LIT35_12170 [Peribacillus asahii]
MAKRDPEKRILEDFPSVREVIKGKEIKQITLHLIEKEEDTNYQKKYALYGKMHEEY